MMRGLWTAATGMEAQQLNIDVISNNLANINTYGFKKSRVDFQDLIYQVSRVAGSTSAKGSQVPTGIEVGLGTRPAAVIKDYGQGEFIQSTNPLDMVIEGDGFFQVQMPDGSVGYTRNGSFKLDSQGRMVTSDGYTIQPEITIPADATNISVGTDGTVSVQLPGQAQTQEIGQIQIARFINPAGLSSDGKSIQKPTGSSGDAVTGTPGINGFGSISQNFIEMSNVKVVEEMVEMIAAQRAYEVNSKSIQSSDEMLSIANNLKK